MLSLALAVVAASPILSDEFLPEMAVFMANKYEIRRPKEFPQVKFSKEELGAIGWIRDQANGRAKATGEEILKDFEKKFPALLMRGPHEQMYWLQWAKAWVKVCEHIRARGK